MATRRTGIWGASVALLVSASIIAGCGSTSTSASGTTAAEPTTTDMMTTGDHTVSAHKASLQKPMKVTIETKASKYGTVLFNQDGQVVYAFENDTANTSNCSGECADFWPPVLADGAPHAMGDLDSTKLGTIARPDGSSQVTYNGWPLYYMDEPAGEIHCQDMDMHGGKWWVVDAAGDPVKGA